MANITSRLNPFRPLTRLDPFRDMDDLFKVFMMRPYMRDVEFEPEIKRDVSEEDKAYTVKADIPGIKKEDIQVAIEGNQVSISAEMKQEKEERKDKKLICTERYYGKQFRSFTLAHDIDEAKAEAEYKDGVLVLTLPKKANGESKKLSIK